MRLWSEVDFKDLISSSKLNNKCRTSRENYVPLIGAFDIETSTHTIDNSDISWMYIWQMAINDVIFYGRTWEDFRLCLDKIRQDLILKSNYKLRVYVHNQKFDFSFFKSEVNVSSAGIIARDSHDVILCIVNEVFEFRDSYCYTEKSLDDMGKEIGIPKLEGYDYRKVRTSDTPLTSMELKYCENDVKIIIAYFEKEFIKYKHFADIPITATQKVKKILWKNYREKSSKVAAQALKLKENNRDRATLTLLKSAYWGAYGFYNPLYSDQVIDNVISADLDSAYPSLALREKFPISKFQAMPIPQKLEELITDKKYSYLITLKITGLKNKYPFVGYFPNYKSKHWEIESEDKIVSQGKILYTKSAIITITDVDLRVLLELYDYEDIKVISLLGSKKSYLPEYITDSIVEVYQDKKKKKIENKKIKEYRELTEYEKEDYKNIKSMVSRIYGVFVQDPEPLKYLYDEETNKLESDGKESIKSASELTSYQWGVWITAYCRYEMIKLLKKIAVESSHGKEKYENRVVYIDTDCVKYLGDSPNINSIITQYNQNVKKIFKDFSTIHDIKYSTIEGIGELDVEKYQKIKVLGYKQYAFINEDGKFIYKISGLSKKNQIFDEKSPTECMDIIKADMNVPAELAHNSKCEYVTYDKHKTFVITDYLGQNSEVRVKSFAVIREKGFNLGGSEIDQLEALNPDKVRKRCRRR